MATGTKKSSAFTLHFRLKVIANLESYTGVLEVDIIVVVIHDHGRVHVVLRPRKLLPPGESCEEVLIGIMKGWPGIETVAHPLAVIEDVPIVDLTLVLEFPPYGPVGRKTVGRAESEVDIGLDIRVGFVGWVCWIGIGVTG